MYTEDDRGIVSAEFADSWSYAQSPNAAECNPVLY